MQHPNLTLQSDLHGFFQELVSQTLDGRPDRPSPVIEQYLVGLLEASAAPRGEGLVEQAMKGPLVVQLSDALHAPSHQRFERLVRLGDGILVLGGLFEPHVKRSGLDERYVSTMGARAYSAASNLLVPAAESKAGALDVLGRMAAEFGRLMALLRDISDTLLARSARSANDWARLCEKWLTQRSAHLERLLRSQGILVASGNLA